MTSKPVAPAPAAASAATASEPDPTPPSLDDRVERLRLQLVGESVLRMPVALPLFNLFTAWLLWRTGWHAVAPWWFLAMTGLHGWRWALVRRWKRQPPADVQLANQWLAAQVLGLAALLALAVALMFAGPHETEHYVMTTLGVGMASGAVVATGWRPQVFALWSALVGGTLMVGWLVQGHAVAVGLAVLIACLLLILLAQTRDQEQALHRLVSLAWDNEQLAASLRIERDRANTASESKTRFFAAASHDLRQPLQALSINAYALAMLARREGLPRIVKLSESIDHALRQSTGLLDGLLDVSRLDAGAVQPDWRDIELGPLLDSLRAEFQPLAAQRGLTLAVEHPSSSLVVRSDADLLRRVLTNLVGNALKFTHHGGVRLVAMPCDPGEAGARAGGGQAMLAVVDTGIGIDLADQERVFEEFYQAANPARDRSQGLGLGLAIVRRIAALLDIGLQLHSQPGRGTRIELRLPLGLAGAARAASITRAPPAADALQPLGLQVLVIDDEPDIRASMSSLLDVLGCTVQCTEDQDGALALVRSGFRPGVILADHRLRHGDGLTALAALHAELGPVSSIMVTGDTAPQTLAQLQASGHRVLHKPVDGATLAQALRELAGRA